MTLATGNFNSRRNVRAGITSGLLLAILGIVLFLAVASKIGSRPAENARHLAAHANINGGIKSALGQYKVDTGSYPKSLESLLQKSGGATNWHGPYFDPPTLPIDPWGNQYIYEYPGKHDTNGYDLFSAGPDGRIGTEDDIGNWQ